MKTKYLVADTTAFIQSSPLHEIAENVVTVPDVINEVRNKRQLRHLVSLTYGLDVKDVFSESIAFVSEFSKKTGDFPCLSTTDIKVLALTYQLEKEHVGTDHIKKLPTVNRIIDYTNKSVISPMSIAGFYVPMKISSGKNKTAGNGINCGLLKLKNGDKIDKQVDISIVDDCDSDNDYESATSQITDSDDDDDEGWHDVYPNLYHIDVTDQNEDISTNRDECDEMEFINQINNKHENTEEENYTDNEEYYINNINDDNGSITDSNGDDSGSTIDSSNGEDDNDDENSNWITPKNITRVKRELNPAQFEKTAVIVGCITTDFAMQNVLKQMGLNVIALDGRVIKEMRTFVLRCYACFKTTSIMKKIFCPYCGNKTLKRVAVSLDADGNQRVHINLKKPLSTRGKRFPLPMPKGGKHGVNPRLVEDARRPHQKPSRLARMKTDALHPDYIAGMSPFAMRDVHSRSAQLGFTRGKPVYEYWMKKNPNEPRRTSKKRK